MQSANKSCIILIFAIFSIVPAFDIVFLMLSVDYRDILGVTHGVSDVMWRLILDTAMMFLYAYICWKARKGIFMPRLMLRHGVFYGLVGLLMCLPMGGYFLAPFSPVGLLYLGSFLWMKSWYAAISIAIIFVAFNLYLIWAGYVLRSWNSDGVKP